VIDDKIAACFATDTASAGSATIRSTRAFRATAAGRIAALQGAREAIVLLKNGSGLLPLDPNKVKTIAVIGPDAFPAIPTAGGSGQVPTFSEVSALKGSATVGCGRQLLYDECSQLSILAMRSGFMLARTSLCRLTVETFDNPQFTGTPVQPGRK